MGSGTEAKSHTGTEARSQTGTEATEQKTNGGQGGTQKGGEIPALLSANLCHLTMY
jgi:hypothetical protein